MILVGIWTLTVGAFERNGGRVLVQVQTSNQMEFRELARTMDLDEATRGLNAAIWATPQDLARLGSLGLAWEPIVERGPAKALTMCVDIDGPPFEPPANWNCYPTWSQYLDLMEYYAATYPEICRLVTIGPSGTGNHSLVALKISDNPDLEEDEPEFFYTGTMHGDELAGYSMTLRLADELLAGYEGRDAELTELVNDLVIWINPLANPDGTFAGGDHSVSGSQRYYVTSGTDPNRSFPDPDSDDDPSSGSWPVETQGMMDLAEAESFTMAANFHGGAEVINYPWDTWYTLHADDVWFEAVSREYADNVHSVAPSYYLRDLDDGITNGAAWYQVNGGRQDFMNYYHGCREVTMEISGSKQLDSSSLEDHWQWNRQAMLDYMKQARYGITGLVTDATTADPLWATIKVVGHDDEALRTWAYTDPDVGDFHRPIENGTWDLEVSAEGHNTMLVNGVVVNGGAATRIDVAMVPWVSRNISGLVTDADTGGPVEGAEVVLTDTGLNPVLSGPDGSFVIENVWDGLHQLRVKAEGYGQWSESIQVSEVSAVFDVELKPTRTLMDVNFETDNGGFTADDGWQWGADAVVGAASGSNVWGTVLGAYYGVDNADWTLNSASLQIPADVESAELVFSHWYSIESGYDGGQVRVSADSGASVLVHPEGGYPDSDVDGLGDEPGFTGQQSDWKEVRVDLTSFAGSEVTVIWRFGTDGSETDYRGWYIDDVVLLVTGGAAPEPPLFSDGFETGDVSSWGAGTVAD